MFIFLNNPLTPFRREDILGKLRFLITETTAFSRNSFLVSLIGATLTPNPSPSRERGIRSYLLLKPAKIIARTKQIPINPPSTQPKTLLNAPIICAAAPVTSNMIAITIAITIPCVFDILLPPFLFFSFFYRKARIVRSLPNFFFS